MSTWLYQLSQHSWPPNNYRVEIWENERWRWPVGRMVLRGEEPPAPGDKLVFFYAPAGGNEPGFYGWAVVLQWVEGEEKGVYFRPVSPSDHLKMDPWWDEEASRIADQIRGKMKEGTLWPVPEQFACAISGGIAAWLTRGNG